ncbi:High mobility group superfamily [Penicillium longicatenatum]|nr:High mobility group superfamily [Penicillium longicatenatum]
MLSDQGISTPPSTNDENPGRLSASPSAGWSPSPQRRGQAPRARATRSSPRERRPRARRNVSARSKVAEGGVQIGAPMSVTTAHMLHIPIRDMHAWAHRSAEERIEEARKTNKIKRPMNAFMMYRSAYAERAKALINQTNYQVVNREISFSWAAEAEEIKNHYRDMSNIEKDNHHRTFPEYRFKPNRGPAVAAVAEPSSPTPPASGSFGDHPSPAWSNSDLDYAASFHDRSNGLALDPLYTSRSNTPTNYQDLAANDYMTPAWNGYYSTVQPSALHGGMSHVEDVHFPRSTPPAQEIQYGISNGLNGLPGGSHHDLLQPQPGQPFPGRIGSDGSLNPQMLSYDTDSGASVSLAPAYPAVPNPYPVWEEDFAEQFLSKSVPSGTSSPAPFTHVMSSSVPVSMQRNPSWDHKLEVNETGESWNVVHTPSSNF